MKSITKKVINFLIVNVLLSSIFYYLIIGRNIRSNILSFGLMCVPAFSSIIIQLIYTKNIKGFGWKLGKLKYLVLSFLIPIMGCIIVYPIVWVTGIGGVSVEKLTQTYNNPISRIIIFILPILILINFIAALGEEIGWRGFLVSELVKKYSYVKTSLIISLIWFIWHCPIIIFSSYGVEGASLLYNLIMASIVMTTFTFITVWIRLKSESLWTATIFHGIHNLFIQQIFDVITLDYGKTKYFTSEFGIGMALFYIVVSIYCIKRSVK